MRRLRFLTVLIVCMLLGMASPGIRAADAGTFEQWASANDGLWGSEITCLWRAPDGTLLAGTDHDGIYVTQDAGMHWQWSGQGLSSLGTAAEPAYGKILSLAGGDAASVYAATRTGLYTSHDLGSTWATVSTGLSGATVYCVRVDPAVSRTIFAGTDNGVYMSSDGGTTWTARNTSMAKVVVTSFVEDLAMQNSVLACTTSGLYKSLDGGMTWHSATRGLSATSVQCLVQDPRRPAIMYAGTAGGICRSFDEGDTWTTLGTAPSGSVLSILVDSFDSSLVGMVMGQGIFVSQDAGEHWSQAYDSGSSQITCALWQKLQVSPDALLGTRGGLVAVSGGSGTRRVEGLGTLDVTAVAHNPNTGVTYAVRGSSLYSSDGAHAWQAIENSLGNARVHGLAVDTSQPRSMYAATDYGVFHSADAGVSWAQIGTVLGSDGIEQARAIAVDPTVANTIYVGENNGLYRNDSGFQQAWTPVGPPAIGPVVAVAMVTNDGRTLYASSGKDLWKTTDRCATWRLVNGTQPFADLTCLVADGLVLYAGSENGVWKSSDGGISWLPSGTGLRGLLVNGIALASQGQVLAGTSAGFFVRRALEDDAGPTVQVSTPSDGTVVSSPQITVSGIVSDTGSGVASLSINGEAAVFDSQSGRFAANLVLKAGINRLVLRAQDLAANVTEVLLTVTYRYKIVLQLTVGSSTMKILPDRTVMLDSPPVILSGRTLVAIRPIVEALGGTVGWSASERKVTIVQGGHTVALWIDRSSATIDGKSVQIDASSSAVVPKIISGRTMLPVRFVAEALGSQVEWDANAKRITITYEGGV